ncbi:hypothetical protein ACHAW6_000230 [Cyclotella cf. meneghiniana]
MLRGVWYRIVVSSACRQTVVTPPALCRLLSPSVTPGLLKLSKQINFTMPQRVEDLIAIARNHFEQKGYRVHSGLQFGCELVLYADSPGRVHSDFCVLVVGPEEEFDWRRIQTLVRSMPNLHKTLIVANVRTAAGQEFSRANFSNRKGSEMKETFSNSGDFQRYFVEELAIASEHAPFRHKNIPKAVGQQIKPSKI